MPNPSLSPAIIEARAICPNNVFEIETLEIRHPDLGFATRKLEVAFLIDTGKTNESYQTIFNNLVATIPSIKSDLETKYNSVSWSLITLQGQVWKFETGNNFAGYNTFLNRLLGITLTTTTAKIALFGGTTDSVYTDGALDEVADKLNWSENANTTRKVILINDSVSDIFKIVGTLWESDNIEAFQSSPGYFDLYDFPTNTPFPPDGTHIFVSGFSNPANNGKFIAYDIVSAGKFPNNYLRLLIQPLLTIQNEAPGNLITIKEVTSLISSNATVIAALQAKDISVVQLPYFANTPIQGIVSGTNGSTVTTANLNTEAEFRIQAGIFLAPPISNLDSPDPIYLVNDTIPHNLPLDDSATPVVKTFETRGFKLRQVGSGENGLQSLGITIDDIDRRVSQFVAKAKQYQSPVELIFRVYLSDDLSKPQNNPPTVLFLTNSAKNAEGFSGTCSTIDVVNHPFPNQYYRLEQFPL